MSLGYDGTAASRDASTVEWLHRSSSSLQRRTQGLRSPISSVATKNATTVLGGKGVDGIQRVIDGAFRKAQGDSILPLCLRSLSSFVTKTPRYLCHRSWLWRCTTLQYRQSSKSSSRGERPAIRTFVRTLILT